MKAPSAYKNFAITALVLSLMLSTIACSRLGVTTSFPSGEANSVSSASWAYRFVKWNGRTYVVTDETVGRTETDGILGKIIKHSTDEHDEFPNSSSNYLQEGAELYAIAGLERDHYIAVTTEDGTLVKAVEREIWEKTKTAEPEAGEAAAKVAPQYDIPLEKSWLTADQVLKQAFSMVEQLQKLGTLAPASVRLTTFDQVAHGGEYLPASTPVWHIVFKADGRVWVPTSGPAVRDPQDAYSHTQVVKTVEIALRAKSGEQVFQGVSGGPLDTALQMEEIKGTIADRTEQAGDQVLVKTAGGETVTTLVPRGMTAEAIDPVAGMRTKLTFWETLHLQPGTPVTVRGLTTKSGDFLSYAMEAEVPGQNLAEIYSLALDSFMPLDKALNHDMKFIAIDTSTLQGATGDGKKQVLRYFEQYSVDVLDATLEQ